MRPKRFCSTARLSSLYHALAVQPARRHWLLGDDVTAGSRDVHGLRGMQTARRAQYNYIGIAAGEQIG
jgi:hypothetical protein